MKGFTLIELLVVAFIISFFSINLLSDYWKSQERARLSRAAVFFENQLRRVSNLAIASSEIQGVIPCGYGISYVNNKKFRIYAGRLGGATSCEVTNHNFESSIDLILETVSLIEPEVVFKVNFPAIFFEPPDPKIYINNNSSIGVSSAIDFCLEEDLNQCKTLTVDTAGRIIIQ